MTTSNDSFAHPSDDSAPVEERAPNGRDVSARLSEVLSDLDSRPRQDPITGRFLPGTLAASNGTLERSEQFWNALEPLKDEIILRLSRDFALDTSTVMTLFGTLDAYAEAHLLRKAMFLRLTELGGPVTDKGKARGLLKTYLAAMDRELKLAQTLGFERKAKAVNPIDAVRAAVAEANKS